MCFDLLHSLHPEAGDLEDSDLWFPKHCILKAGCDRRHHSRLGAETLQLQGWLLLLCSSVPWGNVLCWGRTWWLAEGTR